MTFSFPETGDTHPDVVLEPIDILLIPSVGDKVVVGTYFGKEILRTVVSRSWSFRQEGVRVVMLTCN